MHEAILKALIAMKKDPLYSDGVYSFEARPCDVILATWTYQGRKSVGIFSMKGKSAVVHVPLEDGCYRNLLDGQKVSVEYGMVSCSGKPIILEAE